MLGKLLLFFGGLADILAVLYFYDRLEVTTPITSACLAHVATLSKVFPLFCGFVDDMLSDRPTTGSSCPIHSDSFGTYLFFHVGLLELSRKAYTPSCPLSWPCDNSK